MNRQASQPSLTLWIWIAVLIVAGVLLLLNNFLLLEIDITRLWPLLLVGIGLQVVLTGDLFLSRAAQNFGITRGSVETGTLRANSGELDMHIQALSRPGRLIAGQYTARSRPRLEAEGNRAVLTMLRSRTWLLSLADWELGLATDLPWDVLLSAYLGEINADLQGLIVDRATLATGLGDIHLTAPDSAAGPITVRSTLGSVYLVIPPHMAAHVTVQGARLFSVKVQGDRWESSAPNRYTIPPEPGADEPLNITVSGVTGSLILL